VVPGYHRVHTPRAPSLIAWATKSRFAKLVSAVTQSVNEHNKYQESYYEQADHTRIFPVATPYVWRHVDKVIGALDLKPGSRVLEIGAGMGRHAQLMSERGIQVVATDLSSVLIEKLKEQTGAADIEAFVSDISELAQQTTERFDFAVGYFMLHHLLDLESAFRDLRAVLRPGARVAFCEPNAYHLPFYVQIALSRTITWKGDRGILNMRPSKLFPAMEAAGFVEMRCERFGFFPPLVANTKIGRVCERGLEAVRLLEPIRAFQIFSATVVP